MTTPTADTTSRSRAARKPALMLTQVVLVALLLIGCGDSSRNGAASPAAGGGASDAVELNPIPVDEIFGSVGHGPGQLIYPRAMTFDALGQQLHIVDRSGRIQTFNRDGEYQQTWWLPTYDRGYPTGIRVHPDTGDLYVADTHEHRVLVYSGDGVLHTSFGSFGEGPGQFTYPTDVAFGPHGRLYVAEYGGNDRIQVFGANFTYLTSFGRVGAGEGEFVRPQSLVFNEDRSRLFITDACNHRILITDPEGADWQALGGPGTAAGRFSYPYSILLEPDDTMIVIEFGNNRIQRLRRDGTPLAMFGGHGSAPGQLVGPWTAAVSDERLYILDSRNNRVQVMARPK